MRMFLPSCTLDVGEIHHRTSIISLTVPSLCLVYLTLKCFWRCANSAWWFLPLRRPPGHPRPRLRPVHGDRRRRPLWWRRGFHLPFNKWWVRRTENRWNMNHYALINSTYQYSGALMFHVCVCVFFRLCSFPGCGPWVWTFPGLGPLQGPRCAHVPKLHLQEPRHVSAAPRRCQRHPVPLWSVEGLTLF